jgi:hypothetical protein
MLVYLMKIEYDSTLALPRGYMIKNLNRTLDELSELLKLDGWNSKYID